MTHHNDKPMERLERFVVSLITSKDTRLIRGRGVLSLMAVLRYLSHAYRSVVELRLWLYRQGLLRHHTLGCQVIGIGNLTVGGTGKTPVVEVFARELQQAGRRVAILSRGYKKEEPPVAERLLDALLLRERRRPPRVVSDGRALLLDSARGGDEPYMLATNLPNVVVLVDKDRVKSGRYAIQHFGCDTLLLDDGFQYLRLKHRVEIVLVDRTNPFGNGHCLPRGVLREPVRSIRRATMVFLTKCDGVADTSALQAQIRSFNPTAEIIECRHSARYLQNLLTKQQEPLAFLRGQRVATVSGIAAPEGFEREVERHGATVIQRERFADHHRYTQQEILDIINRAHAAGASAIVTTEKDAVRFPRLDRSDVQVLFLRVQIELLSGLEDFNALIARICFRDTINV
ncbi:MAG: tetraacyldisaccharide 4'-kinase [Kiritimatiellia bacterium]